MMKREQYLCVKAIRNEVYSLRRDGWVLVVKTHSPEMGLMYYLSHPKRGSMCVQSNLKLNAYTIYKNGKIVKCQNFGV